VGQSAGSATPEASEVEPVLKRKLGLAEALALSIVGPSMAMAFNFPLAVKAAGQAAPLAFAIGTLALGVVALAFVRFSRRVAHRRLGLRLHRADLRMAMGIRGRLGPAAHLPNLRRRRDRE